jgi:single-strand DNA-binding protein
MSRGLNKVMIIGQLERDPEMRFTPSGRPVTSFSVSTTHEWLSSEGIRHEETEWFNVVAWGELARVSHNRLEKGKTVYVEGRLKTRSWEDNGGKRHFRTEIVAKDIVVIYDSEESPLNMIDDDQFDDEYTF